MWSDPPFALGLIDYIHSPTAPKGRRLFSKKHETTYPTLSCAYGENSHRFRK